MSTRSGDADPRMFQVSTLQVLVPVVVSAIATESRASGTVRHMSRLAGKVAIITGGARGIGGATAIAYAADLAANCSPTSMAVMKQQVYADQERGLVAASDDAVGLMKASLKRADFKEGVASFLEKRLPHFLPVQTS